MAVTSAARQESEERQGVSAVQQPSRDTMIRQDQVASHLQKRNIAETEENSEVKRIKINQAETKLQMENFVNEEWKRISLGIDKQVQLKVPEATDAKMEFGSELKRTIINKPLSESKQTTLGTGSGSKTVTETQQKKVMSSDTKQERATEKTRVKRRRWDDEDYHGKSRKHEDDKRSRQRQSPSYKSTRSPPRGYITAKYGGRLTATGKTFSLRDKTSEKDSPGGKDSVRKTVQPKDVIVIDDKKPKDPAAATSAEKSPVVKPTSSSNQPTSTSAAASNASSSFKFSWISKPAKPTLLKPVQCGPMPGRKLPAKGMIPSMCIMSSGPSGVLIVLGLGPTWHPPPIDETDIFSLLYPC